MSNSEIQDLLKALETLDRFSDQLGGFHEQHQFAKEAAMLRLQIQLINLYVLDYAKGLQEGMDPLDATLSMLGGKRALSEEQAKVLVDAQRQSLN